MFSGFGLAGFVGFRRISVGFVANVRDSERRVTVVGIDTTGQDIGRTNARENIGSEAADARERRVCIGFASGLADKRRIEWFWDPRNPAVNNFGVQGLVNLGLGFCTGNLTFIFLNRICCTPGFRGLDLVVNGSLIYVPIYL
ncbi:hypothetical protein EV424DRAFT_1341305 [Suillus variegatus]|nr:hypothetical protein EV424DRAFT_1341305 [Suillus variegatus]